MQLLFWVSLFGLFVHLQVTEGKLETGEDASLKVKTVADTLLPFSREDMWPNGAT